MFIIETLFFSIFLKKEQKDSTQYSYIKNSLIWIDNQWEMWDKRTHVYFSIEYNTYLKG